METEDHSEWAQVIKAIPVQYNVWLIVCHKKWYFSPVRRVDANKQMNELQYPAVPIMQSDKTENKHRAVGSNEAVKVVNRFLCAIQTVYNFILCDEE